MGYLLVFNVVIYINTIIDQALITDASIDVKSLIFGSVGILASMFLIVIMSVSFASKAPSIDNSEPYGCSLLSEGINSKDKNRTKKIVGVVALYALIWIVGIGVLFFYVSTENKYKDYPQVSATVSSVKGNPDDGYRSTYEYVVDGVKYHASGKIVSNGDNIPRVGYIVTIKYNLLNPQDIHLINENFFFLVFSMIFILVGLVLVLYQLYRIKMISVEFFLAIILLGISATAFITTLTNTDFESITLFFRRYSWFHFIMIFVNLGLMMLFEGTLKLFTLKKNKGTV